MSDQISDSTEVTIAPAIGSKIWLCVLCGFVYQEHEGFPEEGIAPGTRWEDVPADWICPECGGSKSDFEMTEI